MSLDTRNTLLKITKGNLAVISLLSVLFWFMVKGKTFLCYKILNGLRLFTEKPLSWPKVDCSNKFTFSLDLFTIKSSKHPSATCSIHDYHQSVGGLYIVPRNNLRNKNLYDHRGYNSPDLFFDIRSKYSVKIPGFFPFATRSINYLYLHSDFTLRRFGSFLKTLITEHTTEDCVITEQKPKTNDVIKKLCIR